MPFYIVRCGHVAISCKAAKQEVSFAVMLLYICTNLGEMTQQSTPK